MSVLPANQPESDEDNRLHLVLCGADALVYTLAEELANSRDRIRITVITPHRVRADVPDLAGLADRGVEWQKADRLDEKAFEEAGLAGATALALVMPDDMTNLHAALCAREVEATLRVVVRMSSRGLSKSVDRLFPDCAVLSDAEMAAPAFVAAALGEVAPTHFRRANRTLYVAQRADVPARRTVLTLTVTDADGDVSVLPAEPSAAEMLPTDLVLAEAVGRPPGEDVTRRLLSRAGRRPRRILTFARAVRAALSRKLGIAVMITIGTTLVAGAVLNGYDNNPHNLWEQIYITLLTAVGSSDVEEGRNAIAQAAQLVLTIAGLALIPLITAAVVDGMVNARLALTQGRLTSELADHVVLVGLGTVGTQVMRQLHDLGVRVVAIDRNPNAPGVKPARQRGIPVITGDAASEETLRAASIDTCQALVVLSTNDPVNLEAALRARSNHEDLRVVLRLFDDDFAQRMESAFQINTSRSVSRLCAPVFAAALLERDVHTTIPVDRHAVLVATVTVAAGSLLDGAPLEHAEHPGESRVLGMSANGGEWVDWVPDRRRVLAEGDRILVVARRAGLRGLVELAT
ncbi:Trk K+ transport system NAD-binding subunit [Actinoplanes lutulentus]|uniref:Trk K+ transport system NAD-binding subunit n=1 Tax=Actinoplanes lutulentus TaxID=1287878 RepID=A0A327ZC43_9ACTN|nr:NAD-binding protein [Actinoplanes lutulentus]MBB2945769.1 Trk K+ transport system NAD-binding subunit [Actinoplanes lutulentus]RAK37818.1 Trk K+ transport system NAD-binding subunit [Actinoplanes lutulentus]